MKRAMLLMSLVLAGHWGAAIAATPVFQLNAHEAGAQHRIDASPSNIGRDRPYTAIQTTFASDPALAPSAAAVGGLEQAHAAWSDAHAVPVNFSRNVDAAHGSKILVSSVAIPDDSLFHFLKNFRARPLQKPERWTMLLVGLCLLLYQVRRRPMRTSIGFNPAARLIGQHAA